MAPRLVAVCWILLFLCLFGAGITAVDVLGTVRGRKFSINAKSVPEFLEKIKGMAKLDQGEHAVIFKGKILDPSADLSEAGVSPNDTLTVVKRKSPTSHRPFHPTTKSESAESASSGLDRNRFEMTKESLEKLNDPAYIEKFFSDDTVLETARKEMLANIDEYEKLFPGFKEQILTIAQDPIKWKEAMGQAKTQLLRQRSLMNNTNLGKPGNSSSNSTDSSV